MGDCRKVNELGRSIFEYGEKQSDPRASAMGLNIIGAGHLYGGNPLLAIETAKRAILVSPDPYLSNVAKIILGSSYYLMANVEEAEKNLVEVYKYSEQHVVLWAFLIALSGFC
jgi:hypothetical protein